MATIKKYTSKEGKVSYHVRIRLRGLPLICGTFPNITKAKEFEQRTEASVKEGRYFKDAEAKKHTLADMIDRYIRDALPKKPKSYQKQKSQLYWWREKIGHYPLSKVTRELLVEQRDVLAGEKLKTGEIRSPSTVVRYLAALSHAFSVAVKDWGWLDDNLMRKVTKPKEPRGRVRFLDDDERTRLLDACKSSSNRYLYLIVVLALSTGMRYSEIMNLTWKDVDFGSKRIILQQTKNGERRMVPLVGHAFDLLLAHSKKRSLQTVLLFPGGRDPQQPAIIRPAWEKALEQSNIEDFRFHDLRHSFASAMAMGKATLTELRILLGHKSHSMTARYSHLTENHTSAIVEEMTGKVFSQPNLDSALGEGR